MGRIIANSEKNKDWLHNYVGTRIGVVDKLHTQNRSHYLQAEKGFRTSRDEKILRSIVCTGSTDAFSGNSPVIFIESKRHVPTMLEKILGHTSIIWKHFCALRRSICCGLYFGSASGGKRPAAGHRRSGPGAWACIYVYSVPGAEKSLRRVAGLLS